VVPDRAGFEAFYVGHLHRVLRACTLVLLDRGEAEDVAAEAFARLWSHWGQSHGEDHTRGYVFKRAMRLCSKRRRRASREIVGVVPDRAATSPDVGPSGSLTDALRRLPQRQRQSVVLRDWAGSRPRRLEHRVHV
jgi:DNA-directed RNA polymerase specialized sigma24 family protein